jgi:hypothetical protein
VPVGTDVLEQTARVSDPQHPGGLRHTISYFLESGAVPLYYTSRTLSKCQRCATLESMSIHAEIASHTDVLAETGMNKL